MISVDVDVCSIGTHDCNENATCMDTDDSYTCVCKHGYSGDGVNCTGKTGFTYHTQLTLYTVLPIWSFYQSPLSVVCIL